MTLIDQLKALGFEPVYPGEESEFVYTVPGEFKVEVALTVANFNDEPLEKPLISLRLPHQCDSWEIVSEEADPSAAQRTAMAFYNEVSRGRAIMDNVLVKLARR